jgi:hypothetical protein
MADLLSYLTKRFMSPFLPELFRRQLQLTYLCALLYHPALTLEILSNLKPGLLEDIFEQLLLRGATFQNTYE